MKKQTPEFSKAASTLTISNTFFTALLYNLKIEAREDLPHAASTDGVHLYYHPERFAKEFTAPERVFVLVHEILHVVLFHSLRRGIREPQRWNIACDFVVNLLCHEYKFALPKSVTFAEALAGKQGCMLDQQFKGMTAEQVYDKLVEAMKDVGDWDDAKDGNPMAGDVMDYDPTQNEGKSAKEVERETAINTEKATQAAKAAGQETSGMKRTISDAQVVREPWYQHLRRFITSMHSRQYNWARIDTRRAVLHGVVAPQQRSEQMGKLVVWVDCSGSITEKQLAAMGAHLSDILKDVTPTEVVVGYFDTEVSHVETFTGPDYNLTLEAHGGGGTDFRPMFDYTLEHHSDAQLALVFTDLYGPFGDDPGVPVIWVSQTERVDVPWGELIYGDLNES